VIGDGVQGAMGMLPKKGRESASGNKGGSSTHTTSCTDIHLRRRGTFTLRNAYVHVAHTLLQSL